MAESLALSLFKDIAQRHKDLVSGYLRENGFADIPLLSARLCLAFWFNNSSLRALVGDKLLANKDGEICETTFDAARVGDKDLVGFYFSAHWCPVWLCFMTL